jgi:hypothetical protein
MAEVKHDNWLTGIGLRLAMEYVVTRRAGVLLNRAR